MPWRDTFGYALSKVAPGLASFATVVVFTRLLGQEGYGIYALLISMAAAVSSLGGGWLCQGVLRYFSDPQVPVKAMASAIRLGGVVSLLCCLVAAPIVWLSLATSPVRNFHVALLAALLSGLMLLYSVRLATLQAGMLPSRVAINETVRATLGFVASILLVLTTDGGYAALTIGVCIGYAVVVSCKIPATTRDETSSVPAGETAATLGRMIRFGFPLSLWLGGSMLLPFADRLLVSHFLGLSQMGIFAASYDLVVRGYSVCMIPITLAIHARVMASYNEGSPETALSLVWAGLRWQVLVFFVSLAAVLGAGPDALQVALGLQSPVPMAMVLPLAAGGFLWQLALLVHKPLELANQTHWMVICLMVAICVSVAVNLILLPRIGIVAAGVASMLSSLTYVALCLGAFAYLNARTNIFKDGARGAMSS